MKKANVIIKYVALIFASVFFLNAHAGAKIVTDIAGRRVTLPAKVDRILLGEGRLFYAVALLEGQKPFARIVGWQGDFRAHDSQTYAEYRKKFPQIDAIPLIGKTTPESANTEKALTLRPDIAIFSLSGHGPGRHSDMVNLFERAGIPVIFVDFRLHPVQNTVPSMQILGEALQRQAKADAFIHFYRQQLQQITQVTSQIPPAEKPTVFLELHAGVKESCCSTAGEGNMGEFIHIAGGNNLARQLLPGPLGTINLEKIIATQPAVYLASGSKSPNATAPGIQLGAQVTNAQAQQSFQAVLSRKGISQLDAVKAQRAYAIWHHFYNSPYNILAIQQFAKWFYPDKFAHLNVTATEKQLYRDFLAIEPSGTYWTHAD